MNWFDFFFFFLRTQYLSFPDRKTCGLTFYLCISEAKIYLKNEINFSSCAFPIAMKIQKEFPEKAIDILDFGPSNTCKDRCFGFTSQSQSTESACARAHADLQSRFNKVYKHLYPQQTPYYRAT